LRFLALLQGEGVDVDMADYSGSSRPGRVLVGAPFSRRSGQSTARDGRGAAGWTG
jgi:hypothetical protein